MGGAGDLAVRRRGDVGVGKYVRKRTLGRSRRRWEDVIKIGLEKCGGGMYWIYLAQDQDKCWAM